jgi:hypothetical protein
MFYIHLWISRTHNKYKYNTNTNTSTALPDELIATFNGGHASGGSTQDVLSA